MGKLAPASPEKMAQMRIAGQAARAANRLVRKGINLLTVEDYPTQRTQAWERLASEGGIRMPGWEERITTTRVRAYLGKIGVGVRDCAAWLGDARCHFPVEFARNNPRMPLYALVGTILENVTAGDAERYPAAFTLTEQGMSLADWEAYAKANGINTRLTATAG